MVLYLYSNGFLLANSNYLKLEISSVSEFKLKQLKSSREEFLLFDFLPYNSLSTNERGCSGDNMLAINIVEAVNMGLLSTTEVVPAVLDTGLSCATDKAKINAMRNGGVLAGNYCESLADRVTVN